MGGVMSAGDEIERALRVMRTVFFVYTGFILGIGIGIGALIS